MGLKDNGVSRKMKGTCIVINEEKGMMRTVVESGRLEKVSDL